MKMRLDVGEVTRALQRLRQATQDLRPALTDIGDTLVRSTQQRFVQSVDPTGKPWAPNAPETVRRYLLAKRGKHTRRKGERKPRVTAAEVAAAAALKRPLVGETKSLSTQIHYEIVGQATLRVGSALDYAATHQFGRESPPPRIPARPFLGLSAEDQQEIIKIVEDHLDQTRR